MNAEIRSSTNDINTILSGVHPASFRHLQTVSIHTTESQWFWGQWDWTVGNGRLKSKMCGSIKKRSQKHEHLVKP